MPHIFGEGDNIIVTNPGVPNVITVPSPATPNVTVTAPVVPDIIVTNPGVPDVTAGLPPAPGVVVVPVAGAPGAPGADGPTELYDSAAVPVSPPATYLRFSRDVDGDVQAIYLGTA